MNLIEIVITAKDLAEPAMASAEERGRSFGSTLQKAGAVATVALVAVAAESVKMATTYESVTTRLVTSAGEQNKNLAMVRQGMLDMAGQVGVSATDLAQAMYYVESAGFHGSDGLIALKAAAQGAAAEGADTTTVVKAMTDVLVDYHLKASDAANVTSQMITAVSFGKTSLQEFSGAFASIVPAASAAGISFPDVSAALAEMTNHGFTAARASQNLAQALRSLLNPTNKMQGAFDQYGVSSATLREKLKGPNGLTDAMQYLSDAATKAGKEGTPAFAAALKELMGTAPGANAALATTGENFAATSAAISGIGKATKDAHGDVQGFAEINQTLGQKVKELQASFDSLMIELGTKLIPVLKDVVGYFLQHKQATLDLLVGLGAFLAALAVYSVAARAAAVATTLWAIATGELDVAEMANPFGLVVVAITALVVAVIYAWNHFAGFRDFVVTAAHDIGAVGKWLWNNALEPAFKGIGAAAEWLWASVIHPVFTAIGQIAVWLYTNAVEPYFSHMAETWRRIAAVVVWLYDSAVKPVFGLMADEFRIFASVATWLWTNAVEPALHGIGDTLTWLYNNVWKPLWSAISTAVSEAWSIISPIVSAISTAVSSVSSAVGGLSGIVSGVSGFLGSIGLANGGIVGAASGGVHGGLRMVGEHGPELVRLPYGTSVMPNSNTMSALGAGGGGGGGGVLTLEFVGGGGTDLEQALWKWIKRNVRAVAGSGPDSVQLALGQG